jgi:hypothetical protein
MWPHTRVKSQQDLAHKVIKLEQRVAPARWEADDRVKPQQVLPHKVVKLEQRTTPTRWETQGGRGSSFCCLGTTTEHVHDLAANTSVISYVVVAVNTFMVSNVVVRCQETNGPGPMGWLNRPIRVRFWDKIESLLRGQVILSI